jgi:hypothetical protein
MGNITDNVTKSISGNIEPAYIVVHDSRASDGHDVVEKYFRVQYNPAEIEIYSVAGEVSQLDMRAVDAQPRAVTSTPSGGKMELSASLWFDKMSAASSFMLEKNIAPTSVSGMTNIAKTIKGEESVQQEVEGFIAALRNRYTQFVTFHWADFSFSGSIISILAQYMMFSMSGLPVRAKVDVRIRQYAGYSDEFLPDFDRAFGNDSSSLVNPGQRVSNILNLG